MSDGPVIVVSASSGVNIEEVAEKDPSTIHKYPIPLVDDGSIDRNLCDRMAREGLGK